MDKALDYGSSDSRFESWRGSMEGNNDLKEKIRQLEEAISQRKQTSASEHARFRYSGGRPSYRYSPIRPHSPHSMRPVRPSRNMKLVVKGHTATAGSSSGDANGNVQYVSVANKLVRVEGNNSATASELVRPSLAVRPRHPNRAAGPNGPRSRSVVIDGEQFVSVGRGNKLIRAASAPKPEARVQRKAVSIDGEGYVRTKSGNLVRVDALRSLKKKRLSPKGRRVCTGFLYSKCEHTADECAYSHTLSPETVPLCLHFQRGSCTRSDCRFTHALVNPRAPICRDFAYKGYCAKGKACLHRHAWECPDWVEKGKCAKTRCRLPHPPKKQDASSCKEAASKEEEEESARNYIQRPMFDPKTGKAVIRHDASASESESTSEDEGLSDDLSGDEAEELLKWYDDNHVEG
ncbi:hypothetical protein GQ54DRAFT_331672 [Martensiomyces pterosporus]|nr:hypothetical protein GQ54DRAFT_331672 [Martensiomyces pterosporus]